MILLFWTGLLLTLIIANAEPSASDEELGMGSFSLSVLSLASFGNAFDDSPWNERKIAIGGTVFNMASLTPILSSLSAAGAAVFCTWCFWFRYRHIRAARKEKWRAKVTPSQYTIMIEHLPKLEIFVNKPDFAKLLRLHLTNVLVAARKKRAKQNAAGGKTSPAEDSSKSSSEDPDFFGHCFNPFFEN